MYRTIALALAVAAFTQRGLCGPFDWPQWQGPDRTAHSKETGLLKEWPKDCPPLAWAEQDLADGAGPAFVEKINHSAMHPFKDVLQCAGLATARRSDTQRSLRASRQRC